MYLHFQFAPEVRIQNEKHRSSIEWYYYYEVLEQLLLIFILTEMHIKKSVKT